MSSVGIRFSPIRRPSSSFISCWRRRYLVRAVHQLRELPYNLEDGLGDFLPPPALKTIAVDFQRGLLDRLNDEVRGSEEENKSVAQTVINTAAHRSKTLAFNYASLALNNSFFLDMLKPPPASSPSHEASITTYLGAMIRTEHGSLEQLKSNFSAAALGMASSGWVWFVTDNNGRTAVLPTFGAGTLLVRSRSNVSPVRGPILGEDVNTWKAANFTVPTPSQGRGHFSPPISSPSTSTRPPSSPTATSTTNTATAATTTTLSRSLHTSPPTHTSYLDELDTPAGSLFSDGSSDAVYRPSYTPPDARASDDITSLGEMLFPLFCVSVHEHAWMSAGYGVWGKEEWLKKFWTVLDWDKVCKSYAQFVPDKQR